MGLIATVKRWIGMIFKNRAEKDFDVKDITSPAMEQSFQSAPTFTWASRRG